MAAPTVEIEGAATLRRTLKAAGIGMEDLKAANAKVASMVAQWAAVRAPRRSGRLGASVRGNRATGRAQITAGSASVPYAGPIHWGWPARNIQPNPWVSNAAVETQPAWLPVYLRDVQRLLDQVKGV